VAARRSTDFYNLPVWLSVYGLVKPFGCSITTFGFLDTNLDQTPEMQKQPASLALLINENEMFLRCQARGMRDISMLKVNYGLI
jgi:hypothetical protein